MARPKTSLLKSKFGRMLVIDVAPNKGATVYWMCKCLACGTVKPVARTNLVKGNTNSCGCEQRELAKNLLSTTKPAYIDGRSSHPLYHVWKGMLDRCTNENCNEWKYYGGRGIKVCTRWLDFWNFVSDIGPRPAKHTI